MKYTNIYIYLSFAYLISLSNCFMFRLIDDHEKYCFSKYIENNDQIIANFVVASDKEQLIKVELTKQKEKTSPKAIIWSVVDKDDGEYIPESGLEEGFYELCFYSIRGEDFYVSMQFYSLNEDHNLNLLATDKEFKSIKTEIKEMKKAIDKIETNARHLNTRNFRHMSLLKEIISSIKRITSLKIVAVAVLSAFQIYIIQKFFGPDKRQTTIKTAKKGEFL